MTSFAERLESQDERQSQAIMIALFHSFPVQTLTNTSESFSQAKLIVVVRFVFASHTAICSITNATLRNVTSDQHVLKTSTAATNEKGGVLERKGEIVVGSNSYRYIHLSNIALLGAETYNRLFF